MITIVVPTRNRAHTLRLVAPSYYNQQGVSEIVFVIDAGTDDSPAVIASVSSRYQMTLTKVIKNPERLGASQSRNVGVAEASNDFILFCDDDEYLEEGYARICLDKLQKTGAAAVSGRRVYMLADERPQDALRRFGNGLRRAKLFRPTLCEYVNGAKFDGDIEIPITNAIILTHRNLLQKFPFDPHYKRGNGYREETDYQMNLFTNGYRILVTNDTHSIHLSPQRVRTGGQRTPRWSRVYWSVHYTRYFYRKYYHKYAARTGLRVPQGVALAMFSVFAIYREYLRPTAYRVALFALRKRRTHRVRSAWLPGIRRSARGTVLCPEPVSTAPGQARSLGSSRFAGRQNEGNGRHADVIILSWNRTDDTIAAITSAVEQRGDKQVLVVDQGSEIQNVEKLERFVRGLREVKLKKLGQNSGVPGGRNIAAAMGNGDYVIALDSDAVFADRDSLARAVDHLDSHPDLCAIGFRIQNFFTGRNDDTSWDYPGRDPDKGFRTTRFIGAGHAIRRKVFEAVGGYDARLFFCLEEVDLCYRMLNAGYRVEYFPDVTILHKISPEHRIFWDKGRYFYTVRNTLYTSYKFGVPLSHLLAGAGAFLIKGSYNGVPGAALRGLGAALRMCVSYARSSEDKAFCRLTDECWQYIVDCEPWRKERVFTKIRRQFTKLPHRA